MTLYEVVKFLHVLAAAAWVGTAIQQQVVGARVARAGDAGRLASYVDEAEWLGLRVVMPASVVALATGIALVVDGGWSFSDLWIEIGVGLFLVSVLTGMLYVSPQSAKVRDLMATRGTDDPEVRRRVRTVGLVARINLLILIGIVADMVVKPGA